MREDGRAKEAKTRGEKKYIRAASLALLYCVCFTCTVPLYLKETSPFVPRTVDSCTSETFALLA